MLDRTKKYVINSDTEKWSTYIPFSQKSELASDIAARSLAVYRSSIQYGGQELYDPTIYAEDPLMRNRCVMGVLLKYYLGEDFIPVENEPEYILALDDYDYIAAYHPLNQLERLKANAAARDKVFDLLRDLKDFERAVSAEINARITAHNDVLPRLLSVLTATATPEALGELSKMEKALANEASNIAGTIQDIKAANREKANALQIPMESE